MWGGNCPRRDQRNKRARSTGTGNMLMTSSALINSGRLFIVIGLGHERRRQLAAIRKVQEFDRRKPLERRPVAVDYFLWRHLRPRRRTDVFVDFALSQEVFAVL